MKFWKYLRWISSIAFVALVITLWMHNRPGSATPTGTSQSLPAAPVIDR